MNYSPEFQAALKTGKVVVRRVFANKNKTTQKTVQFMQEIDSPVVATGSLVAMAQGFSSKQRPTALFSFNAEVLEKLGIEEGMYCEGDTIIYGETLFPELNGTPLNIAVEENFTANPLVSEQQPKTNPSTGEVITFNGKAVYRHTELVPGVPVISLMTQEKANLLSGVTAPSKTIAVDVTATEEAFAE